MTRAWKSADRPKVRLEVPVRVKKKDTTGLSYLFYCTYNDYFIVAILDFSYMRKSHLPEKNQLHFSHVYLKNKVRFCYTRKNMSRAKENHQNAFLRKQKIHIEKIEEIIQENPREIQKYFCWDYIFLNIAKI